MHSSYIPSIDYLPINSKILRLLSVHSLYKRKYTLLILGGLIKFFKGHAEKSELHRVESRILLKSYQSHNQLITNEIK